MRKHIAIVSEESIYAGRYKCGIGEVVDCMAHALREYYDVTVVTIGTARGGMTGRLLTLGVDGAEFYDQAAELLHQMQPDLVHNFGRPDFILQLQDLECPKVLTFDRWEEDVTGYEDCVAKYDRVVTLSTAYAEEMKAAHPEAAQWPLEGLIAGIAGDIYFVHNGIWGSDEGARMQFYRMEDRADSGKKLIVCMGRLQPVKGTAELIAEAEAIAATGAELVVWGTGESAYEEQLQALNDAGVLHYRRRMCGYGEMMKALRAADFYLMPSRSEVCGLQPMKAARVGCVPIVTPVGGMAENFDDTTAIFITDGIAAAVQRAVDMTDAEYATMKAACEAGEWTWSTRILPWLEVYGLPTAPKSEAQLPRKTAAVRACPFAKKEENDG